MIRMEYFVFLLRDCHFSSGEWMFCIVRQIFTEDMDEVKSLPRENVLNFIEKADETLVVPYLVSDVSVMLCVTSSYLVWMFEE